jgi:gliding motility-associated-like protein
MHYPRQTFSSFVPAGTSRNLKDIMNRLLPLLLLLGLSFVGVNKAWAQPTVSVDPDFQLVNTGDQLCLDFPTLDFTDLQEMRFTIRFNPDVVQVANIGNLNGMMTGLDIGDFTIDNVEGYIIFDWKVEEVPGCPSGFVTLDDDEILFDVCFDAISTGYTEIEITDDPEPIYVTRLNSCPLNIGMFVDDGFIAVDNNPLTINVPFVNGNEGETICVDFTVENFQDIVSLQFSVNWLTQVMEFESVECLIPVACSSGNINATLADNGIVTFSWFNPNPNEGLDLPDGTSIMQLCFTITGNCGQATPLEITSNPTAIEITYENDPGVDIGVLGGEGQVSVNCFNPNGLTINIPDADICPGESFCLDVTTENFDDLVSLEFSLGWNPDVIQFDNITNFNNDLFLFGPGNVNTAGANNGSISVDWDDASCLGETLSDGEILFTLCFTSVGGGGVNTAVSVTSNPLPIEILDQCSGSNIGVNSFNGLVDVCNPPGIAVIAGTAAVNPGEQVCIPISVQEFDEVQNMEFTIIWETSVLQFESVGGFNLSDLDAGNFDTQYTNFGALCLSWQDLAGMGITVNDGTEIFEVCFTAVGDPFQCTEIGFAEFPCEIDVVTNESNGFDVGITPQNGEVCMLNPFNFAINVGNGAGLMGDEVCVDFTVQNFVSLSNIQFSINFDETVLEYNELLDAQVLNAFNVASYNDSDANLGVITVDWNNLPAGNGQSLPNGTVIFSLCFDLIGDPAECSDIEITGNPLPIEVFPQNSMMNIGLISDAGEICIGQTLTLVDAQIINVDCPGDNAGAIDITVEGGSGNYEYNWSGPGVVVDAEDQTGLTDGTYNLTVVDAFNANLSLDTFFVIGLSANAPIADAGEDTSLPCGEISMMLDGSGSSQGGQFVYEWSAVSGGFVAPGTETTLMPEIIGSGDYQLAVTDQTSGCTVFDTIVVDAAIAPAVVVNTPDTLTCTVDTVSLSGAGSSSGPNFTTSWTTVDGMLAGATDVLETQATAAGWYFLEITNTQSLCTTIDSVFVELDTMAPVADAGVDTLINCTNNTVDLDGSGSSAGNEFTYEWLDPDGDLLTTNLIATASEAGAYQLIVTDTTNGCFSIDEVQVTADTLLPTIVTAVSGPITCLADTINLLGTGSSVGPEFIYQWTGPGVVGGAPTTIDAQATVPGVYGFSVENTDNGCQSLATVSVAIDTVAPVAVATVDEELNCFVNTVPVSGQGSSAGQPGDFTYEWTGPGVISGSNTIDAIVNEGGFYTLTVTNTNNGCTATSTIEVIDLSYEPVITIGIPDTLNCLNENIILDATGSQQGVNILYQWSAPGPQCINTTNPLEPIIDCPGTYTLQVIDQLTGCVSDSTVIVIEDDTEPMAVANDTVFTCLDSEITLDGTLSSQGPDFEYEWIVLGGGSGTITGGSTTLSPTVDGVGSFGLTVTNILNGCTATDIALVVPDTVAPITIAGADQVLTCNDPEVTLDGTGSASSGVTFQWLLNGTPVPGATSNTLVVNEGGTYTLEVTSQDNGCVGTDEVIVDDQTTLPTVDAGADEELGCEDDFVSLDGSNSDSGTDFIINWTALSGSINPLTANSLVAEALEAGTYVLTIENTVTGCVNTDTVEVIEVIGLDLASASIDGDACELDAFLMGNLPESTTGVWTTLGGAVIEDPNATSTLATDLDSGVNTFVWTLSSGNCPDYSADTISIDVEGFPIANNDQGVITDGMESIELNLLANDITTGIDNFDLTILPFPGPGAIDPFEPVNGVTSFFPSDFFNGEVEFQYELCNTACPNFCDTAFVFLTVEQDIDLDNVPNGITPNGDGFNDQFVLDILLGQPDKYPDNEIVIFNRWGDIVFQAAPYLNDWDGSNADGSPLPAGTYYYILRLDVAEGEIIRGDVTVVR